MLHTCHPSSKEAEARGLERAPLAWSTEFQEASSRLLRKKKKKKVTGLFK